MTTLAETALVPSPDVSSRATNVWSALGWTLACWILLIPVRGHVMGYGWYWLAWPPSQAWSVFAGAYLDLVYLACAWLIIAGLLFVSRARWWRRLLGCVLVFHCTVTLIWGVINIEIVKILGQPLNRAWLYNSGFLRGLTEPQELRSTVTPGVILSYGALVALFAVLGWALSKLLRRTAGKRTAITLASLSVVYVVAADRYHAGFYHPMLQTPAVAFVDSLLDNTTPRIFTMETDVDDSDFRLLPGGLDPTSLAPRDAEVRNVLVIMLESVAAQYLPVYGGKHAITPELDRLREHTRVYDAFYAHAPNTNKSLFSMLCSVYPSPDYLLETVEHPEGAFSFLSQALKDQGYRTGMFYGADLRFGDADLFVAGRGFDKVADYRTIGDGKAKCISNSGMPFLDSTDDATLASEIIPWLTAEDQRPFFAVMWSEQTHYPYFVMGEEVPYPGTGEMENSYLNALRETDAAMGLVFRELEARKLLESTLIVIVGDHGEAFGQHQQYGHGSRIYQENIHIPMLLINPRLFRHERDDTVGGTIDIAPTIMDLLKLETPAGWQGRSLFSQQRPPRTYFMASWSNALFGFREGSRKYVFDAMKEKAEVYDIPADQGEATDLGSTLSKQELEHVERRLARWVQTQRRIVSETAIALPAIP